MYITICNSDYTIVTVMKISNKYYLGLFICFVYYVVRYVLKIILKLEKVITNKIFF